MRTTAMMTRITLVSILLAAALAVAQSGVPDLEPDKKLYTPVPTITFTFAMEGANPGHYSIALESTGKAAYQASETIPPDNTPGDPYMKKFVVSSPGTQRIFDLAAQANLFQGNFEYKGRRVANMGAKTLSFADAGHYHQASYNYSTNPVIQQITDFFQGLMQTLEYGRRLTFKHRYDRLGLDEELKSMEQQEKRNSLRELQVDEDILQVIASDTAVMHITRQRAQGLLGKIQAAQAEQRPTSGNK